MKRIFKCAKGRWKSLAVFQLVIVVLTFTVILFNGLWPEPLPDGAKFRSIINGGPVYSEYVHFDFSRHSNYTVHRKQWWSFEKDQIVSVKSYYEDKDRFAFNESVTGYSKTLYEITLIE